MDYRLILFSQIHEIVFNGNGGYDWDTVYNMPLWLRRFIFNKLYEYYKEKENNTTDRTIQQGVKNALIERQLNESTYTTKASKK